MELVNNTWSDIIKRRIPKSFQHKEEDTYEVEASNQFEEIDNRTSSTSAPLSSPSRTRDKSEELL